MDYQIKKNNEKENYFEVQENSKDPLLKINKKFRIIATSNFDKINQISPAFVNRFQVITLEDQISFEDIEGIQKLVKILANKYQYEYYKNKNNKKINKQAVKKTHIYEKKKKKFKIEIPEQLNLEEEQIDLIMDKIKILSENKNPNDIYNSFIKISKIILFSSFNSSSNNNSKVKSKIN